MSFSGRIPGRVFWTNGRLLLADRWPYSRDNLAHHIAEHIRQPRVAALEAEGEPGVSNAEQVQDGGLQVVGRDGVFGDVEAGAALRGAIAAVVERVRVSGFSCGAASGYESDNSRLTTSTVGTAHLPSPHGRSTTRT